MSHLKKLQKEFGVEIANDKAVISSLVRRKETIKRTIASLRKNITQINERIESKRRAMARRRELERKNKVKS